MTGLGRIPQDKIDEVRLAADVVEVVGSRIKLTQKGKDWWGLCPFHGDKDPSLKVDRGRGTWYCFGCSEGGSVFNFLMKDQGLSFPEAVKDLAGRYGVQLPKPRLNPAQKLEQEKRARLLRVLELAGKFFTHELQTTAGKGALEYLTRQRGLDDQSLTDYGMGFAPDSWEGLRGSLLSKRVPEELAVEAGLLVNRDQSSGSYDRFRGRVMLPIRGMGGSVVSFGGRILGDGEPKYMNGPESPVFHKSRTLYNMDRARPHMRKKERALIVEGYFDVITLAAGGFGETVAPMGTALTQWQVRRLKGQAGEVVLIFDGDQAGLRAALRSLPVFLNENLPARVLLLPQGEDPDTFLRGQGSEALSQAIDRARPLLETALDKVIESGDLSSPEGRSQIVGAAGDILGAIKDPVIRAQYLDRFAKQLDLPTETVAKRLGLPLDKYRPVTVVQSSQPQNKSKEQRCILEFALSSPQAARALLENGSLAELTDPDLQAVASSIGAVVERGAEPNASAVIQTLEDQALAVLVNQLSQCRLDVSPEDAVRLAGDFREQISQRQRRGEKRQLLQAMRAAQQAGDLELLSQLQAKHRELSTHHASSKSEKD